MKRRDFWERQLEDAWGSRSVLWLSGVRRVGKTTLCRSLESVEYFDCELPRVRARMEDPEAFLRALRGKRIVLDEIHRLANPSELLKIAADHFPDIGVLATGSSTLGASAKFRDTLAGRKAELWLTPLCERDLGSFEAPDLGYRLLRGGLPPFFLSPELPERDFQEWMDAFWAKDIQELFRLERRHSFQRFVELLMAGSGGIFEATRFARPCEVSRTTITNYLAALEATFVAHVVRPFTTHSPTEIVSAPKVYGFDTGFVCYYRAWHDLRAEDLELLWEHYVLNELHANLQTRKIQYWRDKQGHELDFVLARRGASPVAIECKWKAATFDAAALLSFRRRYPQGPSYVVAQDVDRAYSRNIKGLDVEFVSLTELITALAGESTGKGAGDD
jgi:hypothetical protein